MGGRTVPVQRRAARLPGLVALLVVVFFAVPGQAQIAKGLTRLKTLEMLQTIQGACGIDEGVVAGGRSTLERSDIRLVTDKEDATLVVAVYGYLIDKVCIADIDLRVFVFQPVTLASTGVKMWAAVDLYENGSVAVQRDPRRFRDIIAKEVTRLIENFLIDWRNAQDG